MNVPSAMCPQWIGRLPSTGADDSRVDREADDAEAAGDQHGRGHADEGAENPIHGRQPTWLTADDVLARTMD